MKYSKSIFILMSINIIIAFILIFIGHQSRNLEIENIKIVNSINEIKQKININQIELALHNDNKYLKKLFSIYHSDLEQSESSHIINLSALKIIKKEEILKVKYK